MSEVPLADLRSDVCLCTGVAWGTVLRLDVLARNSCAADSLDQAGIVRKGKIEPAGPDTYRSTLLLKDIEADLTAAGHAVDLSEDAGGYVCNNVFYRARHAIARLTLDTVCGFTHLPALASLSELRRQVFEIRYTIQRLVC